MNDSKFSTKKSIKDYVVGEIRSKVGLMITLVLVLIALAIGKVILVGSGPDLGYSYFGADAHEEYGEKLFDVLQDLQSESTNSLARILVGEKEDLRDFARLSPSCKDVKDCEFNLWADTELTLRKLTGEGIKRKIDWSSARLLISACPNSGVMNNLGKCTLAFQVGGRSYSMVFNAGSYEAGEGGDKEIMPIISMVASATSFTELGGSAAGIKDFFKNMFN